jgi:hypothetical protein
MADHDRTPEQVEADEALRKAVERAVAAHGHLPAGAMLQDFIVQGRGIRWDEDGEQVSHIFTCFPDGALDPITVARHATAAFFKWGTYAAGVGLDGDPS